MKVKGFITHKLAEEYSDCQDFFAINSDKKVVAIADGMSQSIFPQWWAEELVNAYVNEDWNPKGDCGKLEELRKRWQNRVLKFKDEQQQKGKPTWMLENQLATKSGAGSTFCGIRFSGCNWEGCVLGDSCLIEVDETNSIVNIWRSQEGGFSNHPDYFDSMGQGKGEPKNINGKLQEKCKLLFVSDPLAEFLYRKQNEKCEKEYIGNLLQLESHENFCGLVCDWRENKHLHNDDTTLIIIEADTNNSLEQVYVDDLKQLCAKMEEENTILPKETQKEIKEIVKEETAEIPIQSLKLCIKNIEECKHNLERSSSLSKKGLKKLIERMRNIIEELTKLSNHG